MKRIGFLVCAAPMLLPMVGCSNKGYAGAVKEYDFEGNIREAAEYIYFSDTKKTYNVKAVDTKETDCFALKKTY